MKKIKIFFANMYDIEAIEEFLEKQAAKGWMIEKISDYIYTFKKCEPVKLKFQLDLFDKASDEVKNPEYYTSEYIEYCEKVGWKYVLSSGKIQVFCSEEENTVQIHTEEDIKLKNIAKVSIKQGLKNLILVPFIFISYLVSCGLSIFILPEPYHFYAMGISNMLIIISALVVTILIIIGIISLTRLNVFYNNNKIRLKKELGLKFYSYKNAGIFHVIYMCLYLFLLIMCEALLKYLGISMGYWLLSIMIILAVIILEVRFIASRSFNRGFSTIIYTVMLIYIIQFAANGGYLNSYIASYERNYDYYLEDSIEDESKYSISIFQSKFSSIMKKYENLLLNDDSNESSELSDMEAEYDFETVYLVENEYRTMYVVFEDNTTYIIEGDLNQEQAMELAEYYIGE